MHRPVFSQKAGTSLSRYRRCGCGRGRGCRQGAHVGKPPVLVLREAKVSPLGREGCLKEKSWPVKAVTVFATSNTMKYCILSFSDSCS